MVQREIIDKVAQEEALDLQDLEAQLQDLLRV